MKDLSDKSGHLVGLSKGLAGIFKDSIGLVTHFVELIAVETRLAGMSLVMILAAAIGIVLLLMSAWLLLMASMAFTIVAAGYGWGSVFLVLAIVNLLALVPLAYMVVRLSRNLLFRFTLQQAKDLTPIEEDSHATA